jgi:hypothetical protein
VRRRGDGAHAHGIGLALGRGHQIDRRESGWGGASDRSKR